MWPFKRKENISYIKFVESLYSLAIDITNNYDLFNKIINEGPFDNKDKLEKNEVLRRKWEVFYFIFTIILLSCEKHQDNYKNIIQDLITVFSSQIPNNNKECQGDILNERYVLYKNSLINKEPGPTWYLANCFLSMAWLNMSDLEGKWLPHTLIENVEITRIVGGTIDFVNKLFDKYEIIM